MKKPIHSFGLLLITIFSIGCPHDNNGESLANSTGIISSTGDHFSFVLYNELPQSILEPVQKKLEDNYSRILADLNVTALKKIIVRIWNNETQFLDAMQRDIGMRYTGATGYVFNSDEIRILFRGDASQTCIHEFCHIVSLAVNNKFGNNPRWFWETVAIYEAGEFVDPKTISYLINGNFPTIAELNSDFNSGYNKIYNAGFILGEYIIHDFGKTAYVNLIKSNANIESTLGISTLQFENGWGNFVRSKYFNQ
jgi:hypothetical protein